MRFFSVFVVLTTLAPIVWAAPPDRPNIIFIMADDLGYGDLGCYGQKQIATPRIDRLAAEGMRLTHCYSGSTVCAPTRCVLMTGMHTGHARIRGNSGRNPKTGGQIQVALRDQDVTVAELLQQAGYATGAAGKWGLGDHDTPGIPTHQGFDQWFGFLSQMHAHTYYPEFIWRNDQIEIRDKNLGGWRHDWIHDRFTEFGLQFIRDHRDHPFFLYLSYTIPHGRFEIPSDKPYSEKPWPESVRRYAAMVDRLDRDTGRIVDLVEELGLTKNTILFFTSDNGPEVYYFQPTGDIEAYDKILDSNGPFRGFKRDLTEGGIRIPMIVRWPGQIQPTTVSDHVCAFWDVLPTLTDLAGLSPPKAIDGITFVPTLLEQDNQKPHDYLYWEFFERGFQQAVRLGRFKALRLKQDRPLELYDVISDAGEQHDIATQHPDVVARVESLLKTVRTTSPYWP